MNILGYDIRLRAIVFIFFIFCSTAFTRGAQTSYENTRKCLIDGKIAIGQHDYVKAFKLLMTAKYESEQKGWRDLLFDAYCNLGICYSSISANGDAMNCFYEAFKMSEQAKAPERDRLLVVNGIASIYFVEKNYAKAEKLMKQCYAGAITSCDSTALVAYAINLAQINNKTGNYKGTEHYIAEARRFLPGCSDKRQHQIDVVELEMLCSKHQYDVAIRKAKKILADRNLGKQIVTPCCYNSCIWFTIKAILLLP
jgi:tetratricopeptide (TPR) repeat protein